VYFHMYSGEKLSSLLAVQENYRYARTKELAPVTASHYAAIADSFYSAEIAAEGRDRWRISNRGRLATVRFDQATLRAVDFARSSGVVGQRHYQGSLYVSLDASDPAPVIALRSVRPSGDAPDAPKPYLVHGRWEVSGVRWEGDGFRFSAKGFGRGEMLWKAAKNRTYRLHVEEASGAVWERLARSDASGLLKLDLGESGLDGVRVAVTLFSHKEAQKAQNFLSLLCFFVARIER
jgi:hypothetical protein